MKIDILNLSHQKTGEFELSDDLFGLVPRSDILARVIHWQQAKRRQGTHAVKERGDVSGSTKKVGKQKGGGCARHGSKRGAQFRGGGIIFGPVVRDHGYKIPKKIRKLGLCMAIAAKLKEDGLLVFDSLSIENSKTKNLMSIFPSIKNEKFLIVDEDNLNLKLASSNIFNVNVLPQIGVNVLDIIKSSKLVFSTNSLSLLQGRLF